MGQSLAYAVPSCTMGTVHAGVVTMEMVDHTNHTVDVSNIDEMGTNQTDCCDTNDICASLGHCVKVGFGPVALASTTSLTTTTQFGLVEDPLRQLLNHSIYRPPILFS